MNNFWSMVAATLVAFVIWDILRACTIGTIKWIRYKTGRTNRRSEDWRIWFKGAESGEETKENDAAPVKMRKIGFGANAEE